MMKRFSFNIGKKLSDENCLAHSPRPHLWRIERSTIAVLVLLTLNGISSLHADTAKPTVATSDTVTRKLIIDPSATSVALGKASLIVSPLTHRNGNYVGNYRLKVRPYFFKNEKGSLLLAASDDSLRKLQTGTAVNFTGKVVTYEDGRIHDRLGQARRNRQRSNVTPRRLDAAFADVNLPPAQFRLKAAKRDRLGCIFPESS